MSHIVQIQTEIRDPVAIRASCGRLSLPKPVFGETKLFSSSAAGWVVRLLEWLYPVACDDASGKIAFDNFEGRWGEQKELDRFLQRYSVEKARIEARRQSSVWPTVRFVSGSPWRGEMASFPAIDFHPRASTFSRNFLWKPESGP